MTDPLLNEPAPAQPKKVSWFLPLVWLVIIVILISSLAGFYFYLKGKIDQQENQTPTANTVKKTSSPTPKKKYEPIRTEQSMAAEDKIYTNIVRQISTGMAACISVQKKKGVSASIIYSTGSAGCGNFAFLLKNQWASERWAPSATVHILSNTGAGILCVYAENKNGHGILSWNSKANFFTPVGKGSATCP